jgi:capsular polysaccharide biosynthesis protein
MLPSPRLHNLLPRRCASTAHPWAKEVIRRLGGLQGISPDQLLDNLTVVQRDELFIQLSYTGTDPKRAKDVVGTVGRVAAERITGTSTEKLPIDTDLTAGVWDVKAPHEPVSPKPLRNGLITLVVGLMLSTVVVAVREYWRDGYR